MYVGSQHVCKAFVWRVQTSTLQPSTPLNNHWEAPTVMYMVSMFVGHSFGESKQVPYNHIQSWRVPSQWKCQLIYIVTLSKKTSEAQWAFGAPGHVVLLHDPQDLATNESVGSRDILKLKASPIGNSPIRHLAGLTPGTHGSKVSQVLSRLPEQTL